MTAYYNEHEPYAAEWLRNLIKAGHIADGVVDERSIEDVRPDELAGYTQCHFFAGIGVWSYALRKSGWPDDRPIWTGSCPCQPFSTAGKGKGFADERHLWPAFLHLIQQCQPDTIFGEQVASKDGLGWLDIVQTDLEASNYANAAVDICAAGIGAPHIRQRLWFVAERMGDTNKAGSQGYLRDGDRSNESGREQTNKAGSAGAAGLYSGLASDTAGIRRNESRETSGVEIQEGYEAQPEQHGQLQGRAEGLDSVSDGAGDPMPTNGFWRDADWLRCRDGKWRPVRPGTSPLVDGAPSRVGRLRAYGNAIVSEAAEVVIKSYMEIKQS